MIAVVTSTIAPSLTPSHDGPRTTFSPAERLEHTRGTVSSLLDAGISEILIADNSPTGPDPSWVTALAPARIFSFSHPPFRNKGLGEAWLLIGLLEHLPQDVPILKISGRYRIQAGSPLFSLPATDIAAKLYFHGRQQEISTRAYVLHNHAVAALFWRRTLDELYARQARIVGPRSLARIVTHSLFPRKDHFPHADPPGALEIAAYEAIRHYGLTLTHHDNLGVEGILGSWINPGIRE